MPDKIENEIEKLLQKGKNKAEIWQALKNEKEKTKLLFYLNNKSLPNHRKKYQVVNFFLAAILLFFTTKKLLTSFSFGSLDIFFLLSLVVPVINIYVLREILRFHRSGYQFLFVLSSLSLLQPENHNLQEIIILCLMIGVSGYLYWQMFPRKKQIKF